MRVLDKSSSTNSAVCANEVNLVNWKEILRKFFTVPSNFKL